MQLTAHNGRGKIAHLKGFPLLMAGILVAAAYFTFSKLGLKLAFNAEQVTVVWPSTGLALAAVLLLGNRILPAIALGAFLTNVTSHEPVATALSIAAGNTLEAWSAATMMLRFTGFNASLGRLRDVLSLVIFSAICSTMLSANIGVLSLCLGGVQPWTSYCSLWLLWWLGDATGALIVAPALLVWVTRPSLRLSPGSTPELLALLLGLVAFCAAIFVSAHETEIRGQVFIYVILPFVIWSGLRFGQHGTTLVTLISSGIAVSFAAHGMGPFSVMSIPKSLTLLQIFMALVAITGLFLGAVITERVHAEEALRFADQRKNEFYAILAHELRNAIAPMGNALYTLQLPNIAKAKSDEARTVIGRQVQQIARLVDDLLDISRIAHGKVELRREHLELADVITGALYVVKPLIEASKHQLSVRLPEYPVMLDADPARLSQVFVNLLANAAKYTPSGGRIAVDASVGQNTAEVRISDNGVGIPPSLLPQIFDLFMQADYSIERSQGGLGIGLTLVKKLVELHGGEVSVTSAGSFKGSEFTVRLPLATSQEGVKPLRNPAIQII